MKLTKYQNKLIKKYNYYTKHEELLNDPELIFFEFSLSILMLLFSASITSCFFIGHSYLLLFLGMTLAILTIACSYKIIHNKNVYKNKTYIKNITDENKRILKNKQSELLILLTTASNINIIKDYINNNFLITLREHINTFQIKDDIIVFLTSNYISKDVYDVYFNKETNQYNLSNPKQIISLYSILMKDEEFIINNKLETKEKNHYLNDNLEYYYQLKDISDNEITEAQQKIIYLYEKIADQLAKILIEYINQKNETINISHYQNKKEKKLIYLGEQLTK